VLVGGTLIILELVLLMSLLEWAKNRVPSRVMRPLYLLVYVGILTLDGVLFPIFALAPTGGLLDSVAAGVQAKAVLALMFAVPLALFILLHRGQVESFEATPVRLSYLVTAPQSSLFTMLERQEEQIARAQAGLDLRDVRIGEAQATVESILDSAVDTVLIAVDTDLRITHFSAGAQHTLGYEPDEMVGHEVQMLFTRAEAERRAVLAGRPGVDLPGLLDALVRSGARGDWAFRAASGETRTLSLRVSGIGTDHGRIGYVLAGQDVTDRSRATQALAEALHREQQSLARLQSAERLRNEVVGNVSHELSTPVTSINGYLEMLQSRGGLTESQQDAVSRALRNTARLRRLVEDLRLIGQVDTGELVVDHSELDLREVVDSCRDEVVAQMADRDLELSWRTADRPVLVRGDALTLREVVLRLTGNAVKFTPDGGHIGVSVELSDDGGVLSVCDTGIGIPEQDQERIFGRFERGSEMEERGIQGAGLGLSIVSTVVHRHGGRTEVDSAPGRGTIVRVLLTRA
jgi:PAS domain S-box-containing protein